MANPVQAKTIDGQPIIGQMTFEEFIAWRSESSHVEWVNGNVVAMRPVTSRHASLVVFLSALMRVQAEKDDFGMVFSQPFVMRTGPDLPARVPDIVLVIAENSKRVTNTYLDGPADIVVEIVSPGSKVVDSEAKLREYGRGGVREYWLIDPEEKSAQFYALKGGELVLLTIGDSGIFRSKVMPNLWIKTRWLWEMPQPKIMVVLREWRVS